ncbi:hypothetical protein N2152v2_001265 [Parachlorella kessleri]
MLPRIPQPESYHSFAADHRTWLGIPHAPNVLSNAAIAVAGLAGLAALWQGRGGSRARSSQHSAAGQGKDGLNGASHRLGGSPGQAGLWWATFASMVLAATGSAYYHWAPSTGRLAADRLGMALTFAWLAAATSVDRRGPPKGLLGWVLAAAALAAIPAIVLYWQASEAAGQGDLRWYGLAQGLSAAWVGYVAAFYKPHSPQSTTTAGGLLATLGTYAAAIAGDRLDRPVYYLTLTLTSGHVLKHVLAGVAGLQLVRMLRRTTPGKAWDVSRLAREE